MSDEVQCLGRSCSGTLYRGLGPRNASAMVCRVCQVCWSNDMIIGSLTEENQRLELRLDAAAHACAERVRTMKALRSQVAWLRGCNCHLWKQDVGTHMISCDHFATP